MCITMTCGLHGATAHYPDRALGNNVIGRCWQVIVTDIVMPYITSGEERVH